MALTVNFYTFAKKDNSTARPTGTPAGSYSCILKDGCSVVSPVIVLNLGTSTNPSAWNYCHIPDFNRYYYATWSYEAGLWSASLQTDPMASYRTEIGNTSGYVLRSAAAYDGSICDNMYPIKAETIVDIQSAGTDWWSNFQPNGTNPTGGVFIVGLLSYIGNNSIFGGLNYAMFTPDQMQEFLKTIYSPDGNPMSIDYLNARFMLDYTAEQIANMSYTVENPFLDYVKSVMFIPRGDLVNPTILTGLWMGCNYFPDLEHVNFFPALSVLYRARITLTPHHQASLRGSYLNADPFTETYLLLPRAGLVQVDSSLFAEETEIVIDLKVDPISGMGVYIIYRINANVSPAQYIEVQRFSCQIGVQVALSETKDIGEMLNASLSALAPLASFATGNITGGIIQAGAAIGNIARARETNGGVIGSNDGFLGTQEGYKRPYVIRIFHQVANEDNTHNGRPLCQVRQIGTLPGYNKMLEGDVEIPGTASEAAEIKAYLEGGFYYE